MFRDSNSVGWFPSWAGPFRGLLCDYESSDGPSFQALVYRVTAVFPAKVTHHDGGVMYSCGPLHIPDNTGPALQLQTCCSKTKVSLLLVRCRCIWRFYETRTHWDIGQLRQGSDGVKPETDSLYFMTSCYVGFLLLWRMKHDHNKGKILPFSALALFARITRIHFQRLAPGLDAAWAVEAVKYPRVLINDSFYCNL